MELMTIRLMTMRGAGQQLSGMQFSTEMAAETITISALPAWRCRPVVPIVLEEEGRS